MKYNTVYLVAHVGCGYYRYLSVSSVSSVSPVEINEKHLSKEKVLYTLEERRFLKEVILQTLSVADSDNYEVTRYCKVADMSVVALALATCLELTGGRDMRYCTEIFLQEQ